LRRSIFYFALVIVLGVVFFFTWQSLENGQRQTWSYSALLTQSKQGNVKSLEVAGTQGIATDRQGRRWSVELPADTAAMAATLTDEGVNVTYKSSSSSAYWLQVLVPNLILLLLIGAFLYYMVRRRRT
jgi:ATP-dependent Zn protease